MKTIKNVAMAIGSMALVTGMMACSSDSPENGVNNTTPRKEIVLTRAQKETLDSEIKFSFDFMKHANEKAVGNGQKNFVISPFSMARDLSLFANGASGQTLDDVKKLLHVSDYGVAELNDLNSFIYEELLNADPQIVMSISNSVWMAENFSIKPSFLEISKTVYDASSFSVDFEDAATAVSKVNDWAYESTNGIIEDFFNPMDLNGDTRVVILDALYFNGKWSSRFNPAKTKWQDFYNNGFIPEKVETMNAQFYVEALINDELSVVRLPYGNNAVSMYVVMANEGYDLNEVINSMDATAWESLKQSLYDKALNLSIPKFKVSETPDMEKVLGSMGMALAYPELENLTDEKLELLEIKQKAAILVDEQGTEAASVSAIGSAITSPGYDETMQINRPFFFVIEEFSTNTVLFMGKVSAL